MELDNESEMTFDSIAQEAATETPSTDLQTDGGEVVASEVPAVPAYEPNYKFKVKDKELEFEEMFRPLVKDPDAEKKIREYHEKYYGIDEVKSHRDQIRDQFTSFRSQVDPVIQTLQLADLHYKNKDIGAVLDTLGLDESLIAEHFRRKSAVAQLSPEAQAEYNRQQQLEREAYYYRNQFEHLNQTTAQQSQQQMRESKTMQIAAAIADPSVSGVAQAFDQQFGQGAFQEELRQRGQMAWVSQKQDVPAGQIAQQMAQMYRHLAAPVQHQMPQNPAAPSQAPVSLKKNIPVIPTVQSTGAAMVKKAPSSFDEMIAERNAGKL